MLGKWTIVNPYKRIESITKDINRYINQNEDNNIFKVKLENN